MKKAFILILNIVLGSFYVTGQVFCPDDVTTSCFSDLSLEECGNATVISGNYSQSQVKYKDDAQTNACNEGTVFRKFYIDLDYNNSPSSNEPFCIQTITLEYDEKPLGLQFPNDITLTCINDIPETSPTWAQHPCDLVGYTYEDEVFDFADGACLKVVRHFTVINWCQYDAGANGTEGLYTSVQVIKIIDEEAPIIESCAYQEIDAVADCEAVVTLTKVATDQGDCPSGELIWTLSVDLWADGTEDLFYGPNEPTPFRLSPIQNGGEISVTLPDAVGISDHKVTWTVTDGCGNVKSCITEFAVVDNKPPTPYCINFLSSTLNGAHDGELVIPASLFNQGAIDNCSSSDEITLSFSENLDDTERIIKCGEVGFQFFRIYATDEAGNQDFCEVFMFVLDNGSCAGNFAANGNVETVSGNRVEGVNAYLMEGDIMVTQSLTNNEGAFSFGEQALMEEYYTTLSKEDDPMEGVDLADYKMMIEGALGLRSLSFFQRLAADINSDGKFTFDDVKEMKDVLLEASEMPSENTWSFIPKSRDMNNTSLDFESKFSIMDFQGGFDYWAVKKGDLTGASESFIAKKNDDLSLQFVVSNDKITISGLHEYGAELFTLGIMIDEELVRSVSTQNGIVTESDQGIKFSSLGMNTVTKIDQDFKVELDVRASGVSAQDLFEQYISDASFIKAGSHYQSDVNWKLSDLRTEETERSIETVEVSAYPSVFVDQVTITGAVQSVNMIAQNGQTVSIESSITDEITVVNTPTELTTGLYFLRVITAQGEKVIKLVK